MNISKSIFEKNQAQSEGGAIKWIGTQPILSNNQFLENYAIYGKDLASEYPVKMKFSLFDRSKFLKRERDINFQVIKKKNFLGMEERLKRKRERE